MTLSDPQRLVKSKQRVADHGEVFTPDWLVTDMIDLVKHESERIDSRVLEPACGSGNFLIPVLARKLATVQFRYGDNERYEDSSLSYTGIESHQRRSYGLYDTALGEKTGTGI